MKTLLLFSIACGLAPMVMAGSASRIQPIALDTGSHSNLSAVTQRAFAAVLTAESDAGLRVHFREFNLGASSYVQLTSLRDGHSQRLTTAGMTNWFSTSAALNGDAAQLELFVAPGESGIRAVVDHLVLPCADCAPPGLRAQEFDNVGIESLCGADDRVASGDNRIGRTSRGCSAWLISNGAVLSAGHCVPNGATFSVNVPASRADGTPVASAPGDQFPIVPGSELVVWDDNGTPNNASDDIDYVVFRLNPDDLGRRAHDRLGFFRVSLAVPGIGAAIRLTGYGTDNTPPGSTGGGNAQNQTLQTSTGGFVGQRNLGVNGTGRIMRHFYAADTTGGNSGSPILWEATGFTIGIHTSGGCNGDGSGANSGTSFNQENLNTAIGNYPGATTRYLDHVIYPGGPADTGGIFAPDHTLRAAYDRVPSGGKISIVAGGYPRAIAGNTGSFGLNGKQVTLVAPVGPVTIGH